MNRISIRLLPVSFTVAALLSMAIGAAAQAPSPLLNAVEVQRLVARGTPDDHAQLNAHFMALADRSDASRKAPYGHVARIRGQSQP